MAVKRWLLVVVYCQHVLICVVAFLFGIAYYSCNNYSYYLPSVLWHCWLGGRKGIRPVKTEWWVASMVICLERGADLHMAQLMPLPLTVSCYSKIQIGFTFLVLVHPGSPGKRAVKRVCVCACVHARALITCDVSGSAFLRSKLN